MWYYIVVEGSEDNKGLRTICLICKTDILEKVRIGGNYYEKVLFSL